MPLTPGARRPVFFWVVLVACLLFAFAISMTVDISIRYYGPLKAPGWNVRAERSGWVVTDIDSRGPAAGQLEIGDRLLAINGDERVAIVGVSYWRNVRGGAMYRLDLERRGERVAVELPLRLAPVGPSTIFSLSMPRCSSPVVRRWAFCVRAIGRFDWSRHA